MHRMASAVVGLMLLLGYAPADAQSTARRLTTIDALRQYPGYYHLQNVLLRGELAEAGLRMTLRTDESEIQLLLGDGVRGASGAIEVRGQLIDVGRLQQNDPRLSAYLEGREREEWPRPGEELFVRVDSILEAPTATVASVRVLALEPWRFQGETVTIVGNFRGRNLFGDLPDAPRRSRYDFVLRGAEGAVWITGLRPRGRGFDLDVDRRLDTNRWVEVTGTVGRERGLVTIEATGIALASEPERPEIADEDAPSPPLLPLEVVFSSPTQEDIGVAASSTVRVQFSRGLNEASLAGNIRIGYLGVTTERPLAFTVRYDGATRSIEIRFADPLDRFRTLRVELLEGITAFDGGPLKPWTLTFSVGE